jgi:antitoxin VapB
MAYAMSTTRHVKLFRNGRNQAVRIPREFELVGKTATMRKQGERIIIEPVRSRKMKSLTELFASWAPLDEEFPEIPDPPPEAVSI